jgi:hypothetical protein
VEIEDLLPKLDAAGRERIATGLRTLLDWGFARLRTNESAPRDFDLFAS